MRYTVAFALAGIAAIAISAHAAEIEITQKNKQFSQKAIGIKVGDILSFKNEDSFSHNVFSLSDAKTFDLGSYPQGQSKKVTFDKSGTVEIECAIHPDMKLKVDVK